MKLYDTDLKQQKNGTYFSGYHYSKVLAERRKLGLTNINTNVDYAHPLIGRKIRDTETNEIYNIESCKKQWHLGWYYLFLIEHNDSHTTVYWELCEDNPSGDDLVIKFINRHQNIFELIEQENEK